LDVPLAYVTNGRQTVEHFIASGQTRPVSELATPVRAWRSYLRLHRLRRNGAQLVSQLFDPAILSNDSTSAGLRYYQIAAVNRALGSISRDHYRVLIDLPAGAGTTVAATALMAKFAGYQTHAFPGKQCGIVYLDDRAVADSTPATLAAVRRLAEATTASLAIGSLGDSFASLDPAAVDLVVVNLAHGGQAADPATWRDVMDRFANAFQVGIVSVPQSKASGIYEYFGRPVYRYTAGQARADGYLPASPAGVPDPADGGPEEIGLASIQAESTIVNAPAAAKGNGDAGAGARSGLERDPLVVAVRIRQSVEYANLAAGQVALAAKLVSLLQLAAQPGPAGRAAARRADELTELELLAELEDQAGGEDAVLRHIALLRQLLTDS
jgi:hypothetical protein